MTQFGKMIGGGSEFRTALKDKLQNFQYGSDWTVFYEAFGNLRREHYVILSEQLVNALRVVDWHGLADFKAIEVGNTDNSKVEVTLDNELMKFIVETMSEEWVNEHQTTNPTQIPEEIRRQKNEIMLEQVKIEAEKSGESSIDWSPLEARLKWVETADISYDQLKAFIYSNDPFTNLKKLQENLEKVQANLENADPNDPNITYRYSETFEDGKKEVKEWGSKPATFDQEENSFASSRLGIRKICPKCLDKGQYEVQPGDNFCRNCPSEKLVEAPRIQEITNQEAQQIEGSQQRPFFPKPRGNW